MGFNGDVDPLTAELYAKIRTLRKIRRMSTQDLADALTAQGYRISRGQLANGETGRVKAMSVDLADHAARALGMTLAQLVSEPVPAFCETCKSNPPAGFTCNACGTAGGAA